MSWCTNDFENTSKMALKREKRITCYFSDGFKYNEIQWRPIFIKYPEHAVWSV